MLAAGLVMPWFWWLWMGGACVGLGAWMLPLLGLVWVADVVALAWSLWEGQVVGSRCRCGALPPLQMVMFHVGWSGVVSWTVVGMVLLTPSVVWQVV